MGLCISVNLRAKDFRISLGVSVWRMHELFGISVEGSYLKIKLISLAALY